MDTIYMQVKQKQDVFQTKVTLNDIVTLSGGTPSLLHQANTIPIYTFPGKNTKKQRIVFSVTQLIEKINAVLPHVTVTPIGEPNILVEYLPHVAHPNWVTGIKIAIICIISFFGSAFTIITFNNDVSVIEVFNQTYTSLTGQQAQGLTWLEVGYALGVPGGILIFFNHFSGHRITTDPTPIEVEMALYEQDINTSIMDYEDRKKTKQNRSEKGQKK